MTVEEARNSDVCRICGKPIPQITEGTDVVPKGWRFTLKTMEHPVRLTLNFGMEFSHTECLEKEKANEGNSGW